MPDVKSTANTTNRTSIKPPLKSEKTDSSNKMDELASNGDSTKPEDLPKEEKLPEPTLEEDFAALKEMNLLRNVMVKLQYGKYPDKKIDGILSRRMNLDETKFQGSGIVRAIISVLSLFIGCTLVFILIWILAKAVGMNGIIETASLVISLFFFSGLGFVVFNSISVPDEKKLKEAINIRMQELEQELSASKAKN